MGATGDEAKFAYMWGGEKKEKVDVGVRVRGGVYVCVCVWEREGEGVLPAQSDQFFGLPPASRITALSTYWIATTGHLHWARRGGVLLDSFDLWQRVFDGLVQLI